MATTSEMMTTLREKKYNGSVDAMNADISALRYNAETDTIMMTVVSAITLLYKSFIKGE